MADLSAVRTVAIGEIDLNRTLFVAKKHHPICLSGLRG